MQGSGLHLEELTEGDCRARLAAGSVGRVAITVGALPAILPVNYALLDGDIVFRCRGTEAQRAPSSGRSSPSRSMPPTPPTRPAGVLVVGYATALWRLEDIERARAVDLQPWVAGPRDHFVRVSTGMISGRRITPPETNTTQD